MISSYKFFSHRYALTSIGAATDLLWHAGCGLRVDPTRARGGHFEPRAASLPVPEAGAALDEQDRFTQPSVAVGVAP